MLELASIIILGILAQWMAWRMKLPAILPLILIGLVVGPLSTFWTPEGEKWIKPVFRGGDGLFPGENLFYFVSLAIGVILFEGGLTLKRREIKGIGNAIIKLISIGALVTFIGTGIAVHFIIGLSWSISLLIAGLVIVTGPTVIGPILRNLPLKRQVSATLKWEGILIDPIGALVAVLVFEFIISGSGTHFGWQALFQFTKILLTGGVIGIIAAYGLYYMIKYDWIPQYLLNVFTLALVLGVFVLSDIIAHESGLVTVVVMGMVLANLNIPRLKDILDFKESLSVLLISILFILLAANMDMEDLYLVMTPESLYLFFIVAFLLRPIGVFLSTGDSELDRWEKLFIAWVGPKGIVAAGVASFFGIRLSQLGVSDAEYITPLVFMIVLGTVLLNATTARPIASILGVLQKDSNGILIVGANQAARLIASYLHEKGRHVVVVDNNPGNIARARAEGLEAIRANIYSDEIRDNIDLIDVGYLMALTGSTEVNSYAVDKFKREFGENGTFRLLSPEEMKLSKEELPTEGLFSRTDDYINLSEVVRDFPAVHELPVQDKERFKQLLEYFNNQANMVPIFLKEPDDNLEIIPANLEELEVGEGYAIVYMGKEYVPSEEEQAEELAQ